MTVVVNDVTFTGSPCRVVETVFNGRYIKAGERTMALIFETDKMLRKRHNCYLYVVQSAYNTGVAASAGTHDKDGCIDTYVISIKTGHKVWLRASRWLRRFHWFAWPRRSGAWANPSSWHFHQIAIGVSKMCPVGVYVPGQEADGWAGKSGLAGHLADPLWRPKHYTPFNFEKWMKEQEDEMSSPKDWTREDWDAFRRNVSQAPLVLNDSEDAEFKGETIASGLRKLLRRTKTSEGGKA